MSWKLLLQALIFLGVIQIGRAQETAGPAPVQIVTLPENYFFIKQFSYPAAQKSEKAGPRILPRVEKIEIVATGTLSKKTEYFSDGSFTETWKSGTTEYLLNSSMPDRILVTNAQTRSSGGPIAADAEFPELDWITAEVVPTKKVRNGNACLVYKSAEKSVWLKEKTRLPVFFKTPTLQITYTFQPPPGEPLELPDKFAEKLESVRKAWAGQKD